MWESNPHAFRHMILSHARLPVPTIPRHRDVEIIAGLMNLHNPSDPTFVSSKPAPKVSNLYPAPFPTSPTKGMASLM